MVALKTPGGKKHPAHQPGPCPPPAYHQLSTCCEPRIVFRAVARESAICSCDIVHQQFLQQNALTGVQIKLSTAYHPQTDGASEHTNKTVNQCLYYNVQHSQKGWVQALPKICFDIMNTINQSTKTSPFILHFRCSPQVIPPQNPSLLPAEATSEEQCTHDVMNTLNNISTEVQDCLLMAKITQTTPNKVQKSPSRWATE
jgi:hypothetical protein